MIFQNSPDIDIFVKDELERLFKSYSYIDLINNETILHNVLLEFMQSSTNLGKFIAKNTADLNEINNNDLLLEWTGFINFNPSLTYQFCNYMFKDAKKNLTITEFIKYKSVVQKHYELLFLQTYLIQTFKNIESLENDDRNQHVSKIDDLKSRGYDLVEKIESLLIENPSLKSCLAINGYQKSIEFFSNEESKKYVSLTTANKYSFYRDADITTVFNNSFLLYINIYIGYFNNNDTQGLKSLNDYFMWFFKEKNKYKPRLQILFEYLASFILVEIFLNIIHIIESTHTLVNERKSVTFNTTDFYLMSKDSLLNKRIMNKFPESIRLDYEMLNDPLNETLTSINRSFSLRSSLPTSKINFTTSNIEIGLDSKIVLAKFNPRNIYHVNQFLEYYAVKVLNNISQRSTFYDEKILNVESIKNFTDTSSSYFDRDTKNFFNWYMNTFFNIFVFDYEIVAEVLMKNIDSCVEKLDEASGKYLHNNLMIVNVLRFTKLKHSYLLDVLDSIYSTMEVVDVHLENRLYGIFGYLLHLEATLDNLVELQGTNEAKKWVKSFIPLRIKQILEFDSHQQYKDWKASILDYWEIGLDHVYRSKIFQHQSKIILTHNILMWFPLFSKKTSNFDYGAWQAHILSTLVKKGLNANNANPEYWLMGEFLFDYAIIDINLDLHEQRDRASEIYKLFVQEFSYNDYVDFNDNEIFQNALMFVNSMFPVDDCIVLPSYNTSILNFLEQTKNRDGSMDLRSNNSFKIQVRAKTRLIVNSTFLGAPIILSNCIKKSLESFAFKTSNLYDPLKIQQTLLKYENYLEVLKQFNIDLFGVFEIYIQECNMCFLLNQHEHFLQELKKPNLLNNRYLALVSSVVYIEDCIAADCKFYASSESESNYMYKRNRFERLDLGKLDVNECRDFLEHHFNLLESIFLSFPLCFKDKSEGLMIEILSHVNIKKEIDLEHVNRLIQNYQRKIRLTKNLISNHPNFTDDEKEVCIILYNFFHERAAFRANSEIFSMNDKAIEQLRRFELGSSDHEEGNIIKFS